MARLHWPVILLLAATVSLAVSALALWAAVELDRFSWLALLAPATAAAAGACADGRGRVALAAGCVGTAASFLLFMRLAGHLNDDAYEPLLTDSGLALVIAVVGFLPVPLVAMGAWAWHAARHPVA
ncbi:MAG: hypothetical protein ACRDHF_09690 [Tepidiformaceae bacterium]